MGASGSVQRPAALSPLRSRQRLSLHSPGEMYAAREVTEAELAEVRSNSIKYVVSQLYASVPVDVTGIGSPSKGKQSAIVTIDWAQLEATDRANGAALDRSKSANDLRLLLPSSVTIDHSGDILVEPSTAAFRAKAAAAEKAEKAALEASGRAAAPLSPFRLHEPAPALTSPSRKRRIDGKALLVLRTVPLEPAPPILKRATPTSITVAWNCPEANETGLIDRYELQYRPTGDTYKKGRRFSVGRSAPALLDAEDESGGLDATPGQSPWRELGIFDVGRVFDSASPRPGAECEGGGGGGSGGGFASPRGGLEKALEDLRPAETFEFRVRARNPFGWGGWSVASRVLMSASAPPSEPDAPFASQAKSTLLALHWREPCDNGEPITQYRLRLKKAGGAVYVDAYSGPLTGFVLTGLEPATEYVVDVAATNVAGSSPRSRPATLRTPAIGSTGGGMLGDASCLRSGEFWLECWDPKSEKVFYFHKLTAQRCAEAPPEFLEFKEKRDRQSRKPAQAADAALEFRTKRYRLLRELRSIAKATHGSERGALRLIVSRDTLLADSLKAFRRVGAADLTKRLRIEYTGEDGIDAGGLTKDWYLQVSRALGAAALPPTGGDGDGDGGGGGGDGGSGDGGGGGGGGGSGGGGGHDDKDENGNDDKTARDAAGASPQSGSDPVALFQSTPKGELEIRPQPGHPGPAVLSQYAFVGKLISKAIFDRQVIDLPFSNGLYRLLVGKPPTLLDLKEVDEELHASLLWMLDNSVEDVLFETFSVERALPGGGTETVDLKEGGADLDVTDDNKAEYVELRAAWRTRFRVAALADALVDGLTALVPPETLSPFSVEELALLVNGRREIDVDEIRAYARFEGGLDPNQPLVLWLWQALATWDNDTRSMLLKFVTGSTRVPLDGFEPPLTVIAATDLPNDALPKSHTCFNSIILPAYPSYEILCEKLLYAMHNTEGFGIS